MGETGTVLLQEDIALWFYESRYEYSSKLLAAHALAALIPSLVPINAKP
jgi:hypothetical protein